MTSIASPSSIEKGRARSHTSFVPAPAPEMYQLLGIFRRGALPLSDMRPAALAAGLSTELVESAFSIATRRGELKIEAARDGTIMARAIRP
jgi:hypothetical protein